MLRSLGWLGFVSLLWFAYLAVESDSLYAPLVERSSFARYATASLTPDHVDYSKPVFVRANATICPSERVIEALTLAVQLDSDAGYAHFVTTERCHYLPANLKVVVDVKDDVYRRVRFQDPAGVTPQWGWLVWNELRN